ncbi:MAG: hypothetical protein ACREQ5_13040 [Candidatus Dormibacteria bacterium]
MSIGTREKVARNLSFLHASARTDLLTLAPVGVRTELVALLLDLTTHSFGLLVTAMKTDHGPDPPGSVHGHEQGWAVDMWASDVRRLVIVALESRWCWTVGLGGEAIDYLADARKRASSEQIVFVDNDQDHVHLQAGNANGEGLRPR